jgi:subfamily B ATP-binding cassette protein MsbA
MGSLNFAMTSSLLGIMCFGGLMVKKGELTGGKLTAFMGYTMWLGLGAASLASIRAKTIKTVAASRNVFRVLDAADAADNKKDSTRSGSGSGSSGSKTTDSISSKRGEQFDASTLRGNIVFEDVRFAYANGPSSAGGAGGVGHEGGPALNLTFKGQQQTALAGPSGAGKSTVASLLLRLYDVAQGRITIGGVDIKSVPISVLREAIGVVDQRPVLWKGTIRENIRYGLFSATDARVEAAARDAFVDEFAHRMPLGLDTVVGEGGSTLSGGQIARIAIARAIVKDPPILILDEATSSLDAASETEVRRAINRIMQHRTTMVIGHSLDAIRDAHHVVVLEEGCVSEEGTIEALKAKGDSKLLKFVVASE